MADGNGDLRAEREQLPAHEAEAYVPMHDTWGYNNRGVAVRVDGFGPRRPAARAPSLGR